MPGLSELRQPVFVEHSVDFNGVVVMFRYDRNKITDAWMARWTELEEQQNTGAMNDVLADLIEAWDVTNEDGSPFPVTPGNIGMAFALPDKMILLKELLTASIPSRAEGEALSPTRSPLSAAVPQVSTSESSSASPQNGAVTSESQTVSASPSPM